MSNRSQVHTQTPVFTFIGSIMASAPSWWYSTSLEAQPENLRCHPGPSLFLTIYNRFSCISCLCLQSTSRIIPLFISMEAATIVSHLDPQKWHLSLPWPLRSNSPFFPQQPDEYNVSWVIPFLCSDSPPSLSYSPGGFRNRSFSTILRRLSYGFPWWLRQ